MSDFIGNTLPHGIGSICLYILSVLVLTISLRIFFVRGRLAAIILLSLMSLMISLGYLLMDAADVAMTEASIGSGLSTIVLLRFTKTLPEDMALNISMSKIVISSFCCLSLLAAMLLSDIDLPLYGEIFAPVHSGVSRYYLEHVIRDMEIPSVVTAILASYRGYDTLGETTVILLAGLIVILIANSEYESKE